MKVKEAECKSLENTVNDQRVELDGYSNTVANFNKKVQVIEDENKNLHYEIEMHKKNEAEMISKNKQLSSEVDELEARLKQTRHDLGIKDKDYETLTAKIVSLENQIAL